jgi:hypothetical protein
MTVDPTDLYGRGESNYRLTCKGRQVWSATLPFTLWDARLTEDGIAGGYAYSDGRINSWKKGDFRVVLLDAAGKLRLNEAVKREHSAFLHTPANPIAHGILLDPSNDRFVVRVADPDVNRANESWWVYRLSTGKHLDKFEPRALMADARAARWIIDARPVPGTPLALLHWWRADVDNFPHPDLGARFTLIDLSGKCVWKMDLPRDYNVPGKEKEQDRLIEEIQETGAILRTDSPGRFDLRFAAEAKQVTFSTQRQPNGAWTVREIERHSLVPQTKEQPAEQPIPERVPKRLGSIVLPSGSDERPSAIRDIAAFAVDGQGRLAFVRKRNTGMGTLVVVDQHGKVLHELELADAAMRKYERWPHLAWAGADRFILAYHDHAARGRSAAWWADVATGKLTAIKNFTCPRINKLVGTGDGGPIPDHLVERRRFRPPTVNCDLL